VELTNSMVWWSPKFH